MNCSNEQKQKDKFEKQAQMLRQNLALRKKQIEERALLSGENRSELPENSEQNGK